jgi:replicative DNA helicase
MENSNRKLELALVGKMMESEEVYCELGSLANESLFHDQSARRIFQAYKVLFNEGKETSVLAVAKFILETWGDLDRKSISEAQRLASEEGSPKFIAEVLRDLYRKRELASLGGYLATSPNGSEVIINEVVSRVEALRGLKEVSVDVEELAAEELGNILATVASYREGEDAPGSVYSGIESIDKMLGAGLRQKEVMIIAARPSMGKTTLGSIMCLNMARKYETYFCSFDMSQNAIIIKLACAKANIPLRGIRTGDLTDKQVQSLMAAIEEIKKLKLNFSGSEISDIDDFVAAIKSWRLRHGESRGVVLIDYIQLMTSKKGSNRNLELTDISGKIRRLSNESGLTFIVLAQLSRAVEQRGGDKRPILADLRDSGSLEQDADFVAMMYRPEYYGFTTDEEGNSTRGLTEILFMKHRWGEIGSVVKLQFDGPNARFKEWGKFEIGGFSHNNSLADFSDPVNDKSDTDVPF